MWLLVLMLAFPCLIVADITCPAGELTCPDGKRCCPVDKKTSCCEEVAGQPPHLPALLSPPANHSTAQAGQYCTRSTCAGTCCSDNPYTGCCPIALATCCRYNNKCCQMMESCCGTGCCPSSSRCCSRGATDPYPWCCGSRQRCGTAYLTCYRGGAAAPHPTALLFALMAAAVAYVTKKL